MQLDGAEVNEDLGGGSRPATSATGDISPIEYDLEQDNTADKQEGDQLQRRRDELPYRFVNLDVTEADG